MSMAHRKVDHSALRTNQAFIIGSLIVAFVIEAPVLVAFVSAVLIIGTVFPDAALFKRIYGHVLLPANIVKQDVRDDNPEPHRFSQGLGGVFTLLSSTTLLAGVNIIGWTLAWMVVALAALNLFAGFCAGCFVYYQLSKRQIPGFTAQPIQ